MSRCKTCGAEITWVTMESGKKMPVDAETKVFVVCDADYQNGYVERGYISHFTTCPDADHHRSAK